MLTLMEILAGRKSQLDLEVSIFYLATYNTVSGCIRIVADGGLKVLNNAELC